MARLSVHSEVHVMHSRTKGRVRWERAKRHPLQSTQPRLEELKFKAKKQTNKQIKFCGINFDRTTVRSLPMEIIICTFSTFSA